MPSAVMLRDHHGRERALPRTIEKLDIIRWLMGEALASGVACDFATPYQAWMVFAELLLRDSDIGAIIARVHPERMGRKQRVKDETKEARRIRVQEQNADLARNERKRVNAKRRAFGYRVA
jgi:hypothetical protein